MVRADGTVLPPFDSAKSIIWPWGIAIDGNDNVWVANAMGHSVTQLCGARPANCSSGTKTGDPISPAGGYIGGLQIITTSPLIPPVTCGSRTTGICPNRASSKCRSRRWPPPASAATAR
jgi:hypothetical protein